MMRKIDNNSRHKGIPYISFYEPGILRMGVSIERWYAERGIELFTCDLLTDGNKLRLQFDGDHMLSKQTTGYYVSVHNIADLFKKKRYEVKLDEKYIELTF